MRKIQNPKPGKRLLGFWGVSALNVRWLRSVHPSEEQILQIPMVYGSLARAIIFNAVPRQEIFAVVAAYMAHAPTRRILLFAICRSETPQFILSRHARSDHRLHCGQG